MQENLNPGLYCVGVVNPNGERNQLTNDTTQTLTIQPTAPEIQQVYPFQGRNDVPTILNIYGRRLFVDSNLSIRFGTVELTDIRSVFAGTHLQATIPAGLTSGDYNLTISYGGGVEATLPNAFRIQSGTEQDLYSQPQNLWSNPVAPPVGETAEIALYLYRSSGNTPLSDVPVAFEIDGQRIGTGTVALLAADSQASTTRVDWTPIQTGTVELTAIIDPANQFAEVDEQNNIITRTLVILPQSSDRVAPRVDELQLKTLSQTVVTEISERLVTFGVQVSDPVPSQGVGNLRYLEYAYFGSSQIWAPVWDSGWIVSDTVNANFFRHELSPASGIHYIQAWARDNAGNISRFPNQQAINYIPPNDSLLRNQTRVYRRTLSQGEGLNVTLTPISGDPDLYIWPPDNSPPFVSNLSNIQVDAVNFTAPVAGEYQVEVYGYSNTTYQLIIDSNQSAVTAAQGGQDPDKVPQDVPAIPLGNQPALDTLETSPDIPLYLPLVVKGG